MKVALKIYDYLDSHRTVRWLSLLVVTLLIVVAILQLRFNEDISEFLPFSNDDQKALKIYQNFSGANNYYFIFENKDSIAEGVEDIVSYMEDFHEEVESFEGRRLEGMWEIDFEKFAELTEFVYSNIPYFLTEKNYARIDSLLQRNNYIEECLNADAEALKSPMPDILTGTIKYDPLSLFTPITKQLLTNNTEGVSAFELYDGLVFSKDMKFAVASVTSPFGQSETENNARLLQFFNNKIKLVNEKYPGVVCHITGGPAIAVGNSSCIKKDSILSVTLAIILILSLLLFTLKKVRNILMIGVSVLWGWLFAIGGLALINNEVSIIVIGISSVILGIAVNYPLHLIAHTKHSRDIRSALNDIITPLVIGNITTIGAFLCLVPLKSVALRDLGLFSSLLLIGTIVFVILYLPHTVSKSASPARTLHSEPMEKEGKTNRISLWLEKICYLHPENSIAVIIVVAVLTIVFGYFSLFVEFDSDISHINYMTEEQQHDIQRFQTIMEGRATSPDASEVYVVSSNPSYESALDEALAIQKELDRMADSILIIGHKGCTQFLISRKEQQHRLNLWNEFKQRNKDFISREILQKGRMAGFSIDAFQPFLEVFENKYTPQHSDFFKIIRDNLFLSYIYQDEKFNVVEIVRCKTDSIDILKSRLNKSQGLWCFDVKSMNSTIANRLSDDFNYIGWACGFIVFFFLWFSFRSIDLALISFIPMAVSWIWILGIMSLLGIKFNIVNIILATFIFGQGDDYTIFITEGCVYEHKYHNKMLASYKSSIIISALIMFIGIGTLIFANHPALRSLAVVTIIGMSSVVFMAFLIPPLIFKYLIYNRTQPITIMYLLRTLYTKVRSKVKG